MPAKDNFFTRFKNTAAQKVNRFLYGDRDNGYGYSSGAVYDVDEPPYEPEQQASPRRRRGQYREERYAQEDPRMNEQQDLFEYQKMEIIQELQELDVMALTPIDAMNRLFLLREKARKI